MDSGVCAGSNSLELVMLGFPQLLRAYAVVLLAGFTIPLLAGDSGLNVAVVVNQSNSNSVALGNYYCERRQVPPQNQLRIHWDGGPVSWTRSQFDETLVSPLGAMLSSRGLTNQINAVLLSMDIPYRVADQGEGNSTTSVPMKVWWSANLSRRRSPKVVLGVGSVWRPTPCWSAPRTWP